MSKTFVVNLFGTPGAGKSTGAAYIFSRLKMLGYNAELVTEFAKDKVWEENDTIFKNQAYIFGKQYYKQSRLDGKVDVIITDSPLLFSIFYNHDPILGETYNTVIENVFNSFNNINFLLTRTKEYNSCGRFQTQEEADALKEPMLDMLDSYGIIYDEFTGSISDYDEIVEIVDNILKEYLGENNE
jgi:adenylate kinase family enzyme